ncbi:Plasmid stabilization system (fragment) [Rhizobium mesoamericanum STM3625]|uniref:Plasmid stabilization system n=1 Tax=Rhizobium mesoamericanum STM3625 TaxID=1211777 RepID=K0PTU6_9HYPH
MIGTAGVFDVCFSLSINPTLPPTREWHVFRIHPFKAHLIVYRVEEDGAIFVILIRHGHEDWAGEK